MQSLSTESIIYKKIIDFVQPQLSRNWFGFPRNWPCLSQLLTFLSSIYKAIGKKKTSWYLNCTWTSQRHLTQSPLLGTAIQVVADGYYWTTLVMVPVLPVMAFTLCLHQWWKFLTLHSSVQSPSGQGSILGPLYNLPYLLSILTTYPIQ